MGLNIEERRSLELALIANFVAHGLALIAMGLLLLPAMPGGGTLLDADRIHYIASHPWWFRLGWLPWQMCAFTDLAVAIALLRTRSMERKPARLVLALTCCAIVPDQFAQIMWVTEGVRLAMTDPVAYLAHEPTWLALTASYAAIFYTAAALGWLVCFYRARIRSRFLKPVSSVLFPAMTFAVLAPLLPPSLRPQANYIAIANACGFLSLQLWIGLLIRALRS